MNIYSKNYNIYLSRQENAVPSDYLEDPALLDVLWNLLCITLNRY